MSLKTIAKFSIFVIQAAALGACGGGAARSPAKAASDYLPPAQVGSLKDRAIDEASGLAASRCQPGVLWTHNDSGDSARVFAIAPSGETLGTYSVTGAENLDWEDIAAYKDPAGKCYVYIGEIGDNDHVRRVHTIYRIAEPHVDQNASSETPTARAERLDFSYPDRDQDAETLLVEPAQGTIYVVTKRITGPAGVYRLPPNFDAGAAVTAEHVAEIKVPSVPNGFVTGGDVSPDGRRVVICDYSGGYEWTLPEGDKNFDDIWTREPAAIDIGRLKAGEAICYSASGASIYVTGEGRGAPIFETRRK